MQRPKYVRNLMKNRHSLASVVLAVLAATAVSTHAHNLNTTATSISFAQDFLAKMSDRASHGQPLIWVDDEFWVAVKTTPGPGTTTGVGGYQTFYVPEGVEVLDVAYAQPSHIDPRGFVAIPMKGQSAIAIGDGPIGAKVATGLTGYTYPAPNVLGINEAPVTASGVSRGTISGVYADTGIFYSTDPRTAFNSYGATPTGGTPPMINNSGDTVGEWIASGFPANTMLGVTTLWDSYQLRAFGRKDVTPIIDAADGRGNAPWGMASAVAGPQSGYAWSFNGAYYDSHPADANRIRNSIEVGPWQRIQYPGSQVSKDQAGLVSTVIGYTGVDASSLGYPMTSGPLPGTVKAIRFAIGQLELGRLEYSAVKLKIRAPELAANYKMYADAIGGDAGGADLGKDHIWRYFDPTVVTLQTSALVQKVAKDPLLAPGGTTSFTITYANAGAVAVPNVVLTDTLPSGLSYLSSSPAASVSGSTLTWALGTVNPGQMLTLTVNVKATTTGTLVNTVTATSNGNFLGYAQDTVEIGLRALLREVKTVTPSNVAPGENVTYTMTVYNEGSGPNGVPLVVTDFLPSGFSYASFFSATVNGAAITPTINASDPSKPAFTVGTPILSGKTLVITFSALVAPNTPVGTYFNEVQLGFEGKLIPPIPEAPVTVGGGQIGDTVFRDWNGNGVQDPGEEGMPGVTVSLLLDANGDGTYETTVGTKTTDATGKYLFTGLLPGKYQVSVPAPGGGGVPTGFTLTADPDGAPPTGSFNKTLTLNETFLGADWGYLPGGSGSIGDTVFEDTNKNGVFDGSDVGIPNSTVQLRTAAGTLVATRTTDASGQYLFGGLALNLSYQVVINATSGNPALSAYFGADPFMLTSANPIVVSNLSGSVLTADFGFFRNLPATVGDMVYYDVNGNGAYDAGDFPLANVTVNLYASNGSTLLATTASAFDGTYGFTGLPPATYVVRVDTTDSDIPVYLLAAVSEYNPVPLVAGQTDNTRDFPFVVPLRKTVDKSVANAGQDLTFTITPSYSGPDLLTNATVTDVVPAGTTFKSATAGGTQSGGTVTWNLGSNTAAVDGTAPLSSGAGAIAQRGPVTTGSTNGATMTINKPTGVVAGDVLIANIQLRKNTTPRGYPSLTGWTTLSSVDFEGGGAYHRCALLYRVVGASEPSSYTFTVNGAGLDTDGAVGAIVAYSGVDTTSPFDALGTYAIGSTKAISTGAISTVSANAAVLMCVGAFEKLTVGSFATTSPGALTQLYGGSADNNGTVGAGWGIKAGAGSTGAGAATLSANKDWGAILVALKPSAVPFATATTTLNTNSRLVTPGSTVTVTLTATATGDAGTVTAGPLTAAGTNGASAVCSPASPLSAPVNNGSATFTYTCTVAAGTSPGVLTFKATPSGTVGGAWAQGTANTVLVTPPLTFTATIKNPPGVNAITNQAHFNDNGNLVYTSPPTTTALTGSIGDFVWEDVNGNGLQDAGEPGIPGVTVYVDSNGNGQFDPGEPSTVTDSTGHYRIDGFAAGTYQVRYLYGTVPAGYMPSTPMLQVATLATATTQYVNADFGLRPPGTSSIGGSVWIDANENGIVDSGELPIPNVDVRLYADLNNNGAIDAGDQLLQTVATDASGNYLFSGVAGIASAPGHYLVDAVEADPQFPPGLVAVSGGSPVNTPPAGGLHVVTISAADTSDLSADFGYDNSGQIGGYVWWDNNRNQAPNIGEPPIPGALVMLYVDADNNGILDPLAGDYQIAVAFTDAAGRYLFNKLPPGSYLLDVYEDSFSVGGVREAVPTTPEHRHVNLPAGGSDPNEDFGYFAGALIQGDVFWDANRDTVPDSGELGLSPVKVTITGNDDLGNPVSDFTTTDASGHFVMVEPEGDYILTYSKPDVLAVNPSLKDATTPISYAFHASAGEDWHPVFEFGVDNSGIVGGVIFADVNGNGSRNSGEPGLSNVTVQLYQDTDNNNQFTPGEPLVDVQATDANGNYQFIGLADGNYVVKVLTDPLSVAYDLPPTAHPPTEWVNDSEAGATVTAGGAVLNRDFGYHPKTIVRVLSGTVFHDINTSGTPNIPAEALAGVTVVAAVDTNHDTVVDQTFTAVTDGNGLYQFIAIPDGSDVVITVITGTLPNTAYVNTVDPDGTPDNTTKILNMTANVANRNFGYVEDFGSIAGTVVKGNGNGVAETGELPQGNVTVTLTYGGVDGIVGTSDDKTFTTLTNASGDYSFTNLLPGNYDITTTVPTGFHPYADADGFNPNNISLALAVGENKVDQDFEYQAGSIGNSVWLDLNGNGTQDPGEPPLDKVRVYIDLNANNAYDPGEPASVTNASGIYALSGLDTGTYTVRVDTTTLPAGTSPTHDLDGIGTPNVASVALASNQDRSDVDFGYRGNATVSGHLYIDTNGNGSQNPGEPNLPNVDVVVTDSQGHPQTVTTDPSGNWSVLVIAGTTTAAIDKTDPQYPTGYQQTEGTDPTIFTALAGLPVSAGNDGFFLPGSISGLVQADTNNDTIGDAPLANVTVTLKDAIGNDIVDIDPVTPGVQSAVTTTAANGSFSFAGLPPGTYQVVESDPVGYVSLTPNQVTVIVSAGGVGVANFVDTQLADLAIVKMVDDPAPAVGSNVTFTLNVTNTGPSGATGVSVTDLLPNGYQFVSASLPAYNPLTGQWTIGSLASGGGAMLQITAKVNATGTYQNTATVTGNEPDPNLANNTDSKSTTPVPQADLVITKGVDHATPDVGSNVVFTLGVTNTGASNATGVTVTDVLPGGYTFVSANPPAGYNALTGLWTIGSLANGTGATLQITAKVNASGPYLNTATATGNEHDPNLANNTASKSTTPVPQADLVVVKTVNNPAPLVGSQVVFTLTATNNGPSDATGVTVTDVLPSGYTFVTANPPAAYNAGSGVWTIGSLANGGVISLQITAKVNAGGEYLNTATATGTEHDPNPNNNTSIRPTEPIPLGKIAGFVLADTDGDNIGDTGIPLVVLTLKDGAGNDIDSDPVAPNIQPTVTTTAVDGSYSFGDLPPGNYRVVETQPTGYLSLSDADGGDPDVIGNVVPIVVTSGHTTDKQTFVEVQACSLGNLVWFDANHNGVFDAGDTGIAGIKVELYTKDQIPGVDTPLGWTKTDAVGIYGFTNLLPGDYVVYLPTAPDYSPGSTTPTNPNDDQIDNDNNGIQPVFGGPVHSPLIHLSAGENDMTKDFGFTCVGTWQEWQILHPLDGKNQPADNPDGDNYDNLIEYAFSLPPGSGEGTPFRLVPSTVSTSRVEFSFKRPVGATANVTYFLEYSISLDDTKFWISIPLSTIQARNIEVTPVSACTENVTIRNFEAREGFVRLRAELIDDKGNHYVSHTGTEGWTETRFGVGTATYNNPYPHCADFTGTVDPGGVSGQTLSFADSAGSTDLNSLVSGAAYYLEVTAGANEGQRFDVLSASGSTVTLVPDGDLCAGTPPFNTLTGAPPASLAGNRVALRRHWTLGELFPPARFLAGADADSADEVQTVANGITTTYWLYANGGSPIWVNDGTLIDRSGTVIPPGQGMVVIKRGTATTVLAYGEVRENKFVRPLCAGANLVGGGFPVAQCAVGAGSRQMDLTHGFVAGADQATADMFSIWKGDATSGATGYDDYYLFGSAAGAKWVKVGDPTQTSQDANRLFPGNRAALVTVKTDRHAYTMPSPWAFGSLIALQQVGGSSTWAQWQATELAGEARNGPNDDPDGDGTPNLLEFVFGTPPLQAGPPTATPVEIVTIAGQRFLQITIPRRSDHLALLSVQVSSDLANWQSGPEFTTVVYDDEAGLVVRDRTPLGADAPKRFMRLRAEVPAP